MPPDPNVIRLCHQYPIAALLNLHHFKTSHTYNKIAPSKYSFHSSDVKVCPDTEFIQRLIYTDVLIYIDWLSQMAQW